MGDPRPAIGRPAALGPGSRAIRAVGGAAGAVVRVGGRPPPHPAMSAEARAARRAPPAAERGDIAASIGWTCILITNSWWSGPRGAARAGGRRSGEPEWMFDGRRARAREGHFAGSTRARRLARRPVRGPRGHRFHSRAFGVRVSQRIRGDSASACPKVRTDETPCGAPRAIRRADGLPTPARRAAGASSSCADPPAAREPGERHTLDGARAQRAPAHGSPKPSLGGRALQHDVLVQDLAHRGESGRVVDPLELQPHANEMSRVQ